MRTHLNITLTRFLIVIAISIFQLPSFAKNSPVGLWQTFDLSGTPRSIVKFYIIDGELRADVYKILDCKQCRIQPSNKSIGATIVKGLRDKGNQWVDGEVTDTDTGKTYNCSIKLSENGNIMYFHAYKGIPLFGKTISWLRVDE